MILKLSGRAWRSRARARCWPVLALAIAAGWTAVAGAQESSSGASDADPDLIVDTIPVGEDDAPELPESERDDPVLNLGTLTVSGDKLGRLRRYRGFEK